MAKNYKRRSFFIKKDFQGKLILSCFLFVIGGGLLFNMLHKQMLTTNWSLIILCGGFVVVVSLLLSHRIAGPLFRFESTLDNMKEGNLNNTIYLRDKDEGKELARKINEFNVQLAKSFRTISHNSKALEILLEQASALDLPEGEKEQLASLCWSMQEHNRKITNESNYFNSKDE